MHIISRNQRIASIMSYASGKFPQLHAILTCKESEYLDDDIT